MRRPRGFRQTIDRVAESVGIGSEAPQIGGAEGTPAPGGVGGVVQIETEVDCAQQESPRGGLSSLQCLVLL
jgi:hypothetical protein